MQNYWQIVCVSLRYGANFHRRYINLASSILSRLNKKKQACLFLFLLIVCFFSFDTSQTCRNLTQLNLENNSILTDGASALADAIRGNDTLQKLYLEGNKKLKLAWLAGYSWDFYYIDSAVKDFAEIYAVCRYLQSIVFVCKQISFLTAHLIYIFSLVQVHNIYIYLCVSV
jgi:hypothetical protein